ncbi:hypothetical protein STRDD13_00090 [Streptococcus sp. DD13]|nr:hypothetical protein STRDD13_00090 [Streptococcus sp. DD13]
MSLEGPGDSALSSGSFPSPLKASDLSEKKRISQTGSFFGELKK